MGARTGGTLPETLVSLVVPPFVDSDESARDTAVYLTLIGSCNMLGIEPYKYFMTILPRLRDNMTKEQLTAMLPYKVAEELKPK